VRLESPKINKLRVTFRTLPSMAASFEAQLLRLNGALRSVEVPSLPIGPPEVGVHDWNGLGIRIHQKEKTKL
jgi:hypothetical protein